MKPRPDGRGDGAERGRWPGRLKPGATAAVVAVLLLGCAGGQRPTRPLATQYDGGNIVGRVAAEGGRRLSGVVRIEELNLDAPVVGDRNEFRFPYMPPGVYRLTFIGSVVGRSAGAVADVAVRVGETSQVVIRVGSETPPSPGRRR
jgi:hypothetical protein